VWNKRSCKYLIPLYRKIIARKQLLAAKAVVVSKIRFRVTGLWVRIPPRLLNRLSSLDFGQFYGMVKSEPNEYATVKGFLMNLSQKIDELYELYDEIKQEIKRQDKYFYERWKAGGFLIDNDIISMYPILNTFVDDEDDE